jgi:hypothetical protein
MAAWGGGFPSGVQLHLLDSYSESFVLLCVSRFYWCLLISDLGFSTTTASWTGYLPTPHLAPAGFVPTLVHVVDASPPPRLPPRAADGPATAEANTAFGPGTRSRVPQLCCSPRCILRSTRPQRLSAGRLTAPANRTVAASGSPMVRPPKKDDSGTRRTAPPEEAFRRNHHNPSGCKHVSMPLGIEPRCNCHRQTKRRFFCAYQ